MRLRLVSTLIAAVVISTDFACADPDSTPTVSRVDSAGVEVVESSGQDAQLDWDLQRELELGGEEEGPESFFFVGPTTVGVDGNGRLFILNPLESIVSVFSPQGDFVRTIGAHGEGPGEISMGGSLSVAADGTVSVFDHGKGGLVRFNSEGDFLQNVPFRFSPWPGAGRHIAENSDGFLVATMAPPLEENTFRHALQLVTPSDTLTIADHSFPRPGMVRYPSCGGGLNLPRIFEVQVSWSIAADRVVVSRSDRYELEVFEGGRLVQKIRRSLDTRPATDELAIRELGEGFRINFGRGPCLIPPREMVDGRGFAESVPWIGQVTVAPGGEVWVGRKLVGEATPGIVDIFDNSGAYRGTLPPGSPFPLVFLDEDRFGAEEKDPMDISRLVVYRIVR